MVAISLGGRVGDYKTPYILYINYFIKNKRKTLFNKNNEKVLDNYFREKFPKYIIKLRNFIIIIYLGNFSLK